MPTLRDAADPAFEDAAAARLAEATAADAAEAAARAEAAAARLAEAAAQAAAEETSRADEPLPAAPPEYYAAKAAEEAASMAAGDAAAGDAAAGDASPPLDLAPGADDGDDEPFSPPPAWTGIPGDPQDRAADPGRGDANAPEHDPKAGSNGGDLSDGDGGEDGAGRAAPDSGMSAQSDLMGSLASDGGMVGYGHGQADEHRPEQAGDHREEDLQGDE